jgi:hypothetical protein
VQHVGEESDIGTVGGGRHYGPPSYDRVPYADDRVCAVECRGEGKSNGMGKGAGYNCGSPVRLVRECPCKQAKACYVCGYVTSLMGGKNAVIPTSGQIRRERVIYQLCSPVEKRSQTRGERGQRAASMGNIRVHIASGTTMLWRDVVCGSCFAEADGSTIEHREGTK